MGHVHRRSRDERSAAPVSRRGRQRSRCGPRSRHRSAHDPHRRAARQRRPAHRHARSRACTARSGSTIAAIACATSTRRTARTSSSLRINDVYIQPGAQIALGGTRLKFEPLGESVEIELADTDRFGSMIGRSVKMRELFARLEKLARDRRHGARHRRDRHRQGARRRGAPRQLAAREGPVRRRRLRRDPAEPDRERAVRSRARRVHRRDDQRRGRVRARARRHGLPRRDRRAAARRCSRSCCACSSAARSAASAAPRRIEVDVRVVAATNRDLGARSTAAASARTSTTGSRSSRVHMPPLRERKDDLPLLIEHFLATTPRRRDRVDRAGDARRCC